MLRRSLDSLKVPTLVATLGLVVRMGSFPDPDTKYQDIPDGVSKEKTYVVSILFAPGET